MLSAEDARLLTQLGFLALRYGMLIRANSIFLGLRVGRPDRAFPLVGLVMVAIARKRPSDGVEILNGIALQSPVEQSLVDAYRGLALQLCGRIRESRASLEASLRCPFESDGVMLARGLLNTRSGDCLRPEEHT